MIAAREALMIVLLQMKLPRPMFRAARRLAMRFLRAGVVVSLASTGLIVTMRSGIFVVGNWGTPGAIKTYSVAVRWAELGMVAGGDLGLALMRHTGLELADPEIAANLRRRLRAMLVASAIVSGVLAVLAPFAIRVAFGDSFVAATTPSRIVIAMIPALCTWLVAWQMLLVLRGETWVLASCVIASLVTVTGSVLIADHASANALAIVTMVAVVAAALVAAVAVGRLAGRLHLAGPELGGAQASAVLEQRGEGVT